MSVNENCLTCPARRTCSESVKFFAGESTTIMISGCPVVCPGPDQLVKFIDENGTTEFFGIRESQKVLNQSLAERIRQSIETPTLTASRMGE